MSCRFLSWLVRIVPLWFLSIQRAIKKGKIKSALGTSALAANAPFGLAGLWNHTRAMLGPGVQSLRMPAMWIKGLFPFFKRYNRGMVEKISADSYIAQPTVTRTRKI